MEICDVVVGDLFVQGARATTFFDRVAFAAAWMICDVVVGDLFVQGAAKISELMAQIGQLEAENKMLKAQLAISTKAMIA